MDIVDTLQTQAPTIAEALARIRPDITARQLGALASLYAATGHRLPVSEGGQFSELVMMFGKIGGRLSQQLGQRPDEFHLYWIAHQVDDVESGGRAWQMNENFAEALTIAGWFATAAEPAPAPAPARNPAWTRDELILALEMYMRDPTSPPGKTSAEIAELSALLNAMAASLGRDRNGTFRNPNGVYMKLMNFRRFDPQFASAGKSGLSRGGAEEGRVWEDFASRPAELAAVASAIRAAVASGGEALFVDDEAGLLEAPEGRVLTRVHRYRERDPRLVKECKRQALARAGELACEVCSFDFSKHYGRAGEGIIECHHTQPLHTLGDGAVTRVEDLALLCANCHRVVHASRPWLSIAALRTVYRGNPDSETDS